MSLWVKIIAIASDEPNYTCVELQKETVPFNSSTGNGNRRDDELAKAENHTLNAIADSAQKHPEALTPTKTILTNVANSEIKRSLKCQDFALDYCTSKFVI